MKYLVLIFLPTIALGLNPYEPGSYQTKHKLIYGFLNNGLNHELDVWAPITAPGEKLPVFYFLGGLGGIIPGIAYTQVNNNNNILLICAMDIGDTLIN